MNKITFAALLGGVALIFALSAAASSPFDISFPVPELGDCLDKDSCKAYCDDSAHSAECFEFAQKHGLVNKGGSDGAKILKGGVEGPGGCKEENECREYCNDPAHIDECLAFAEKHGFVKKEDAARIKKAGFTNGPGGCKGQECRAYCEDLAHHAECIEFAEKNGLMSREEAERAKKFAGKTGPGGCKGEECKEFCDNPLNAEACLEFAAKEGLMPPQEIERARKFMRASQEGGPGGCKGQECRAYCEDPAHHDECFDFAKKQGLIGPGEEKKFEAGKKIRQKMQETGGPGGCKTEDECHAYCSDPSHAEECVAFGAAHGGLPEEEVRRMLKEFQENSFEGHEGFRSPEEFRRFEEEGQKRFQEFRALEEQFRGGPQSGGFPGGPGFSDFGHGQGQGGGFGNQQKSGGFSGPGGCTSPAECIKYCAEHKEECFQSGPSEGTSSRERGTPQLRGNLIMQFDDKDLPEQFPGRPGQFDGSRPFPGEQGQFPSRSPEGFHPEEFQKQFPEGFRPPEGSFAPRPSGTFEHQSFPSPASDFQQQSTPPPSGGAQEQQSAPPPSGEPAPPPPSSQAPNKGFFANIIESFGVR